jgi:hypothetical protein
MKTIWLFILFVCFYTTAGAQDSWKLIHNGTQKLQANAEDAVKNTIAINKAALTKKGCLKVTYTARNQQKDWKRTIALFDEKDAELLQQDGALLKVSNARLKTLSDLAAIIKVYTWSLPADPDVAATVRVRRIHLCTIVIKDKE